MYTYKQVAHVPRIIHNESSAEDREKERESEQKDSPSAELAGWPSAELAGWLAEFREIAGSQTIIFITFREIMGSKTFIFKGSLSRDPYFHKVKFRK